MFQKRHKAAYDVQTLGIDRVRRKRIGSPIVPPIVVREVEERCPRVVGVQPVGASNVGTSKSETFLRGIEDDSRDKPASASDFDVLPLVGLGRHSGFGADTGGAGGRQQPESCQSEHNENGSCLTEHNARPALISSQGQALSVPSCSFVPPTIWRSLETDHLRPSCGLLHAVTALRKMGNAEVSTCGRGMPTSRYVHNLGYSVVILSVVCHR